MKKYLALALSLLFCSYSYSQDISLSFAGRDVNNNDCQLDRVIVVNQTKGWCDTLYWPDLVLTLTNTTGIKEDVNNEGFVLSQNNPNPFDGSTDVNLNVTESGAISMELTDMNGRNIKTQKFANLQQGTHQFHLNVASPGVYMLTAYQNGKVSSIKMVNNGGTKNGIEYYGVSSFLNKGLRNEANLPFSIGDQVDFVGYTTFNTHEIESEHVTLIVEFSQTVFLPFNILQGLPVVTTFSATYITTTSAILSGVVTNDSGHNVIDRGICYGTTAMPDINDNCLHIGTGTGVFSQVLSDLDSNTTYYARAFAINEIGIAYGDTVSFSTIPFVISVLEDSTIFIPDGLNCITPCHNSIANVSVPTNATISQAKDILSVRLNIEHSYIGDLNLSLVCPDGRSAILMPDHNDAQNYAYFGLFYKPDGSYCNAQDNTPGTGWNYCWSEDPLYAQNSGLCYLVGNIGNDRDQTIDSSHLAQGFPNEPGFVRGEQYYLPYESFSNLIGCPVNGNWQIQICDVWESDNGYLFSWEIQLKPSWIHGDIIPSVTTLPVTDADLASAVVGGDVINDGGSSIVECGICYNTTGTPTISDNVIVHGSGLGEFVDTLTGLTPATTYYVSAYAVSSQSISYGLPVQFSTRGYVTPTVNTLPVSDVSATSAICGGNVTSAGEMPVTERGICYNTTGMPTISDSVLPHGTGLGEFIDTLTGLIPGSTYFVRAYAINLGGVAYGDEMYFFSAPSIFNQPCTGTPTLTDVDGNVYNTVQIGNQCWMKENLRTTHYADSTPISQYVTYESFGWLYPQGDSTKKATYGLLYDWGTVMNGAALSNDIPSGVQGVCPTGWHVPSDGEWKQLELTLGMSPTSVNSNGVRGSIAVALAADTLWAASDIADVPGNTSGTNRNFSGFSAIPAGLYWNVGGIPTFNYLGSAAYFYSTSKFNHFGDWLPCHRNVSFDSPGVGRDYYFAYYAMSVRCLKD